MSTSVSEDLQKADAAKLERTKFQNWMLIASAVRERVKKSGELRLDEIPSRSLMLRKSEFPASTVRAAISLDGQRVDLHWQVREGINGLVEEASATFGLRLSESASLYFTREGDVLGLEELSKLIVSLATKF
jgi:hypothetical protein